MLISLNIAKTTCALAFHYWFEPLNKGWYVACTMMSTIGRQDFEKKRCFCLGRIKNLHEKTAENYNLRYRSQNLFIRTFQ